MRTVLWTFISMCLGGPPAFLRASTYQNKKWRVNIFFSLRVKCKITGHLDSFFFFFSYCSPFFPVNRSFHDILFLANLIRSVVWFSGAFSWDAAVFFALVPWSTREFVVLFLSQRYFSFFRTTQLLFTFQFLWGMSVNWAVWMICVFHLIRLNGPRKKRMLFYERWLSNFAWCHF